MDKNLSKKMSEQVNNELHAAYLYLVISEYFESLSLKGFAAWMLHHAEEELSHAMKLYRHLVDRGERVVFPAIPSIEQTWGSPLEAMQAAYGHEIKVTKQINALYELADSVRDLAAKELLLWFAKEQVEEEDVTRTFVEQLKLIGNMHGALIYLDHKAGKQAQKK